ncbi:hypothetical protein PTI98_009397 [Pleurotus ostreatus]|nr:hypothetical protein PTI98_009397 [Pleurotus ostreatus]
MPAPLTSTDGCSTKLFLGLSWVVFPENAQQRYQRLNCRHNRARLDVRKISMVVGQTGGELQYLLLVAVAVVRTKIIYADPPATKDEHLILIDGVELWGKRTTWRFRTGNPEACYRKLATYERNGGNCDPTFVLESRRNDICIA